MFGERDGNAAVWTGAFTPARAGANVFMNVTAGATVGVTLDGLPVAAKEVTVSVDVLLEDEPLLGPPVVHLMVVGEAQFMPASTTQLASVGGMAAYRLSYTFSYTASGVSLKLHPTYKDVAWGV